MNKKILAIHDIACVGRCSLTVVLPIISAMGFQVCPLPTALLSSHFDGFKSVVVQDLTDNLKKFNDSWIENKIKFDSIYTGFLGSNEQVDICIKLIKYHKGKGAYIYVDPVMADDGCKYSMMNDEFVKKMKKMIAYADLITPNYTEACLLLDRKYKAGDVDPKTVKEWLVELSDMGAKRTVITGIKFENKVFNIGYDSLEKVFYSSSNKNINDRYSGTGDIFGSVLISELLKGTDMGEAIIVAAKFVTNSIEKTIELEAPLREGLCFEQCLCNLKNS